MRVDRVSPNRAPAMQALRPQGGDGVKIIEDCQVILDIAFAVIAFLVKAEELPQIAVGAGSLGLFSTKALLKCVAIKIDHRIQPKNRAEIVCDYLFWINIIANISLSIAALAGREKAILFSAIILGLNTGTKLITVIVERTLGAKKNRYAAFLRKEE